MPRSRGDQAGRWIEKFCMTPMGPDRGQYVRLTDGEKSTLRQLYDHQLQDGPITGRLAACVALLHLCGTEALGSECTPLIEVDSFTVWSSAGPDLLRVLKREGAVIKCRRLGTQYPAAA